MILRDLGFMRSLDILVAALLVIGGLNWGFVGIFGFNLLETLFSSLPVISRIIYAFVGLSALYEIFQWKAIQRRWNCTWSPQVEHGAAA